MAKTSLNSIKEWFKRGLKPTQEQFWNTFDSFWHKDEQIEAEKINGLQALLDSKASATSLSNHTNNTANPHNTTKEQVGLGNVDNTSDADKPISIATSNALAAKADVSELNSTNDTLAQVVGDVTLLYEGLTNVDSKQGLRDFDDTPGQVASISVVVEKDKYMVAEANTSALAINISSAVPEAKVAELTLEIQCSNAAGTTLTWTGADEIYWANETRLNAMQYNKKYLISLVVSETGVRGASYMRRGV